MEPVNNLTVEQLQGLVQKVKDWTDLYKDGQSFYVDDQSLSDLSVLLQDSLRTKQQVNTLQGELNIAHYANETLSNQYHQIREHNHKQGKQIQSLQIQVNTLTEAFGSSVVYSALRYYYKQGLFEPDEYFDLDTAIGKAADLQSIKESPREEQTK